MSDDDEAADDETEEIEEVVAAVVEYLDEENLLKTAEECEHTEQAEVNEEANRMHELPPVIGADGREFY